MKGCLLGTSAFYYLVSIDDYYVAAWAAGSRDEVPELVYDMLHGGATRFAYKSHDKQSVIDYMVSQDKIHLADSQWSFLAIRPDYYPKYRGYRGRKRCFALHKRQPWEMKCR